MNKVNLGSGINAVDGWINIDNTWNIHLSRHTILKKILHSLHIISTETYKTTWPSSIIKHDIRKSLPFEPSSIDYVYSSHFLEHVTKQDAQTILENIHKILKPSGLLRITVPDMYYLAKRYTSHEISVNTFLNETMLVKGKPATIFESLFSHSHKWMYDEVSLIQLLLYAKFNTIKIHSFRKGNCPDLNKLENHKNGIYIEALK